jgi:MYXO-CTERM domain-containing protein
VVAEPLRPIAEADQAVPAAASWPWPWIFAGLAGLFVLALAEWLRRRRNQQPLQQFDADLAAIIDGAPHELLVEPETVPMPVTAAAPRRHAPSKYSKRPMLDVSFVPAKASISLANLTIKGQMRIVNSGDEDVDAMQLNAAIITASERQNEMISAYFSGAAEAGNELGAVKIGERIALDLDLVIPIAELQTFGFGEQKLLVPIILSRILYQWRNTGSDEAQLSCIIGRESSPPKPKMGALRLDLGPRSFAPLGQRPIFG